MLYFGHSVDIIIIKIMVRTHIWVMGIRILPIKKPHMLGLPAGFNRPVGKIKLVSGQHEVYISSHCLVVPIVTLVYHHRKIIKGKGDENGVH